MTRTRSPQYRVTSSRPKVLNDGRRLRFCFSDSSRDRMNDTIDARGWDLAAFNRNPVCLWAHDSSQPPIGRASDVRVEGERLMGTVEFAPAETYGFSDVIYKLCRGGYINAVSVGFLPTDYDIRSDGGVAYKRQELLEVSVVPVPANSHALVEARAKGINLAPLVQWARKVRKADDAEDRPPRSDEVGYGPASCGRPIDQECGLKDPSECWIHGFGQLGQGRPEEAGLQLALLQRISMLRSAAMRDQDTDYRRRLSAIERQIGPGSQAEVLAEIATARSRHWSPALRAVVASAPLRW